MATGVLRRRGSNGQRTATPLRRDPPYYLVAGVALELELDRLRALPVFAGGPLALQRPLLKVRRARKRPIRLGFAVPSQFRLSVTAYPGIRPGDILETLLHELVHLHVGRSAEAHAWHGRAFRSTLATAIIEGYGISLLHPPRTRHGVYANAIERARLKPSDQSGSSAERQAALVAGHRLRLGRHRAP
ncbi:MAG: hypothetical protein WB507_02810 [Solirubrobacterales bacterium]